MFLLSLMIIFELLSTSIAVVVMMAIDYCNCPQHTLCLHLTTIMLHARCSVFPKFRLLHPLGRFVIRRSSVRSAFAFSSALLMMSACPLLHLEPPENPADVICQCSGWLSTQLRKPNNSAPARSRKSAVSPSASGNLPSTAAQS